MLALAFSSSGCAIDFRFLSFEQTSSLTTSTGTPSSYIDIPISTPGTPQYVTVGDFNGDGNLDFVTANLVGNSLSWFIGHGDGTFDPQTELALGFTPTSISVNDLNGDGKNDLIVGDFLSNLVHIEIAQ